MLSSMSEARDRYREWTDAARRAQAALDEGAELATSGRAVPRRLIAKIARLDGEVERRQDAFTQAEYDRIEDKSGPG